MDGLRTPGRAGPVRQAAPSGQRPGSVTLTRSFVVLNNAAQNVREELGARSGARATGAEVLRKRTAHRPSAADAKNQRQGDTGAVRPFLGRSLGDKTDLASIGRRDTVDGLLRAIIVELPSPSRFVLRH